MRGATALGLALLAGCATYAAAPPPALDRPPAPGELDEAAVRDYLDETGWTPARGWDDHALAVAALALRPEVRAARAAAAEARAGIAAAGTRPRPGLDVAVERVFSGEPQGPSPWLAAVAPTARVELGGKRDARMARAEALAAAADLDLSVTGWQVVVAVRRAVLERAQAARQAALADDVMQAASARADAVERLVADGAAGQEAQSRALELVADARASLAEAGQAREGAAARLAAAVGLRTGALPGDVASARPAGCALVALGADSLERAALSRRLELGRALAAYRVADEELRLRVAEQSPDLVVSPALVYDQGAGRWAVGAGLSEISLARRPGTVAAAEAARETARARALEVQRAVLADLDGAIVACRAAAPVVEAADSVLARAAARLALVRAAFERGERGSLDTLDAALAVARARQRRDFAAALLDDAALGLETSLGLWLDPSARRWPDLRREPGAAPEDTP